MIKFFKKHKENILRNVALFWKLAVCLMFLGAVFSAVFGYYLFVKINKGVVLRGDAPGAQIETVKKERIEKALEYFSERTDKSIEILNAPAPIIDPSL